MISQTFIRELLERADIYEVVNRRVPLQSKGANGWACCPFHNEKSPSFSVSRDKQIFHCFGCGEHGNAIGFIMKYENLPFPDAVEKLAQECGVKVVYDGKSTFNRNPEKPRLTDIMERAQKYYRNRFLDNSAAQKYIKDRGLTDETLEKFGIGFAPDGWHNLDSVFSPDDRKLLIDAGLQREGNGGSFYDFFRNRLMFPIRNIRGQIIAFSARTMIGEEPKYINTGDTPIFTKGKEVFGLYEARRSIQEKKRVIVVEGQMDAIQLSQAGFGESCAPLGTAIRSEHVERLLKMTDHIIFSFDGDTAGRKAALRAMDICLPLLEDAQKAVFVFLPEGEDPDSLVKNQGPEAFEKLISQGLPLSSYLIESTSRGLDLSILEDKGAFLDAAAPYIRKTKSVLLRDGLIERIATAAGYKDTDQLARYFGFEKVAPIAPRPSGFRNGASARFGKGGFGARRFNTPSSGKTLPPKPETPILVLLRNFLRYPQLALEFEGAATEHLSSGELGPSDKIFKVLQKICQEDDNGDSLLSSLGGLPSPSEEEVFESEMEKIRNILQTLLLADGEDKDIKSASERGRTLRTPLSLARLETKRIFLQIEFEKVEQQRKALCSGNSLTQEQRQLFQSLLGVNKQLSQEVRDTDRKINEELTFRTR